MVYYSLPLSYIIYIMKEFSYDLKDFKLDQTINNYHTLVTIFNKNSYIFLRSLKNQRRNFLKNTGKMLKYDIFIHLY